MAIGIQVKHTSGHEGVIVAMTDQLAHVFIMAVGGIVEDTIDNFTPID
tara:strand:+ start:238 stop:381 length:144 start_codon:yes stop_codon:yes gene_type:complete